ncbi:hypothetical protein [Lentzea cavernae]|uniref:MT0933-like antitoxin protein n=1 Tax=Lentzea cavernae TaxID=2020703 RepID=A0ABQ3MSW2_9PSEU|nr:hypothetical protein [Lentzea cavernae]GHH57662.1 hypothetical protein GCM10017774_77560 [Lentzea cavernae]
MPSRFGEQVSSGDAYQTARGATKHMSNDTLAAVAKQSAPDTEQHWAAHDEIASRGGK